MWIFGSRIRTTNLFGAACSASPALPNLAYLNSSASLACTKARCFQTSLRLQKSLSGERHGERTNEHLYRWPAPGSVDSILSSTKQRNREPQPREIELMMMPYAIAYATPSFFCRLVEDVVYWKTNRLFG